jgi:hypothetical protein
LRGLGWFGLGGGVSEYRNRPSSIELLVAVAIVGAGEARFAGCRPRPPVFCVRDEAAVVAEHVERLIHRRVAHHVGDPAVTPQSGLVEITAIGDADEIRHRRRRKDARALTGDDAGRNRRPHVAERRVGHRAQADGGLDVPGRAHLEHEPARRDPVGSVRILAASKTISGSAARSRSM